MPTQSRQEPAAGPRRQRVRTLWARAHDHLKGQLWMKHVYGHNGHAWNDRADEGAERGKGGAPANGLTGGGNGGVDDKDDAAMDR